MAFLRTCSAFILRHLRVGILGLGGLWPERTLGLNFLRQSARLLYKDIVLLLLQHRLLVQLFVALGLGWLNSVVRLNGMMPWLLSTVDLRRHEVLGQSLAGVGLRLDILLE